METTLKLLINPVVARMAIALVISVMAFLGGIALLRLLRRKLVDADDLSQDLGSESTSFPYSAVIQELKQQKFELQHEHQTQRRRAKTSEQITAAVIANLPCGLLFLTSNGLVRQANAAARNILGFASPLGLSVEDIFRNTLGVLDSGEQVIVAATLKSGSAQIPEFDASYQTPAGDTRTLKFTPIRLQANAGESLGVAIVITDDSAAASQRSAQVLQSETSAEMALELRTSLSTIREYAGHIGATDNRQAAMRLVNDISAETERLDRVVGGFLAGSAEAKASAVGV